MKQRGENTESDNYLVIAKIKDRIFNAKTEYEECAKKFNCERLTEEEIKSSYVERHRRTFQRSHGQRVAERR
jgi:uncharacterized protein (DUF111 family)